MKKTIILTGSQGDIGREIKKSLLGKDFEIISIDKIDNNEPNHIVFDFNNCLKKTEYEFFINSLDKKIKNKNIFALINNAAVQKTSLIADMAIESFTESLNVNVITPFLLSKKLLPNIKKEKGHIINIGSIHSKQTKKEFLAYATSKAALEGFTKSLSVEVGAKVKVNMISPAAINTKMLKTGLNKSMGSLDLLKKYHPTNQIGKAFEISKLVNFILTEDIGFLNGSVITLDGGISSLLHDPDA